MVVLPDLQVIVSDLREVVKFGIGAIPDSVALSTLSGLRCVDQLKQGPNRLDTIIAVEHVIRETIDALEGTPSHSVFQRLFGLTPATTGALAKQRRREAAAAAGTDPGTFNRHDEQRLLRLLARQLYAVETETLSTEARLGPPPSAQEIRASWLQRFAHYGRMQMILRELRLDLIAVLLTYTTHSRQSDREDYLDSSIWRYSQYLHACDRFADALGAIWLMPEPAADIEAKTAAELVLWHGPFNERGRSWLRMAVAQASSRELHSFAHLLGDSPEGLGLLGLWEQWLESCRCDPDRPEQSCRPHQVIDHAERFAVIIEEQWSRVCDAYRELAPAPAPPASERPSDGA